MDLSNLNIHDLAEALSKEEIEEFLRSLPANEVLALKYRWSFWARRNQLPPLGDWTYWMALAGRGFGKTRMGAEWIRSIAESGEHEYISLIGPTNGDVRRVMIDGESGLLKISPPWFMPEYQPSKARVVWPNGCVAELFSAEEPDRLRGPQCSAFWADELAAWGRNMEETWSNLMFGFRLGKDPKGIITTTPRPLALVKKMAADESCIVTSGTTYENAANLAKPFFKKVITDYEGTRLGRQELLGHILDDNPNALFQQKWFDSARLETFPVDCETIAVGVDPQVKEDIKSDEAGIVVAGMKKIGGIEHYYIAADDSFQPEKPDQWGRRAARSYYTWQANKVVAEVNNGGALVKNNIQAVDSKIPVEMVTATRGKSIRAEPVATLAEQGRIHFCGKFLELETQCIEWDPTITTQKSPDRMDAFVWVISYLSGAVGTGMVQGRAAGR